MKFKKGDYVKILNNGKEGIVVEISEGYIKVIGGDYYKYFTENELTHTENKKDIDIYNVAFWAVSNFSELRKCIVDNYNKYLLNPTKKDLRLVDVIQFRDGGKQHLVTDSSSELACFDGKIDILYKNDLTHKSNPYKDIVAIYKSYCGCDCEIELHDLKYGEYRLLKLWERSKTNERD